jgi:hypothetical protein
MDKISAALFAAKSNVSSFDVTKYPATIVAF